MTSRTVISTAAALLCCAAITVRSQAPTPPNRQALIDELVIANHILANEGVLDGYGHVSVRSTQNRDHFFLARAGAPALVTAADIVEYDYDSNPVDGSKTAGYQERFIHGEIYRARPDVMAVIHCHCPEVIPFADTGVPLRPMYHMGYFIGEGVPVFDNRAGFGLTDMLMRDHGKPAARRRPPLSPEHAETGHPLPRVTATDDSVPLSSEPAGRPRPPLAPLRRRTPGRRPTYRTTLCPRPSADSPSCSARTLQGGADTCGTTGRHRVRRRRSTGPPGAREGTDVLRVSDRARA